MNYNDFLNKYQKQSVNVYGFNYVEKPVVSICVVTFQHANYIKQCLDGILMQQTSFLFEVLLGEDASTDGTREICLEYAAKHPDKIRLFLHHRENNIAINGNPTGRFNFLYNLYNARGKYIALCEGDDYWTDPLKLQKQVDFLEGNKDFALCFHNVFLLNERQGQFKKTVMHKGLSKDVFKTEDLLQQWFIPTTSIVYRNYKDFEFPDWFYHCQSGDIPLLLLVSLKGKFKYIDEVMGCYRLHSSGISTTHNGYLKVISMIYIYQSFNIFTNEKFKHKITDAIKYEIHRHLPEMRELSQLKSKKNSLLRRIVKKIKKMLS